jgi:hypothetical protein
MYGCDNVAKQLYFTKLINCCDDANFTDNETGNTLLHYVSHPNQARLLVPRGFTNFHHRNREGRLPIHSMRYLEEAAELVEFLVNCGLDLNAADSRGRTVIHYLSSWLQYNTHTKRPAIISAVRVFLANGVDVLAMDNCKCACSSNGCAPVFVVSGDWDIYHPDKESPGFIWGTELLCTLEEHEDEERFKTVLLSVLRRHHFDALGMTHVCARDIAPSWDFHLPQPAKIKRALPISMI